MVELIKITGLSDYLTTIKIMEDKLLEVIDGTAPNTIYLIEYNDIYTAGSSYHESEILTRDPLNIIHTDRGGKLTFHGPGQRIIYPIFKLSSFELNNDIKKYLNKLTEWIMNTLIFFGLKPIILNNLIGIWVKIDNQDKKIASIGIRLKKWVAYHGIAININTELDKFKKIIPCGLKNSEMTSLKDLSIKVTMDEFDQVLKAQFFDVFKCEIKLKI